MKGMCGHYALALLVISTIPDTPLAQVCTETRPDVGRRLDSHLIYKFDADTLTQCLYDCALLTHCLSLNYDISNKVCELNTADSSTASESDFSFNASYIYTDISSWPKLPVGACIKKPCSGKETCIPAPNPVCEEKVCSPTLPAVSGAMIDPTGVYYIGDETNLTCPRPEMRAVGDPTIRCGRFAQWSQTQTFECKHPPSSCAEVKLCGPEFTSDGEYWLFPSILAGQKVKVYCENMSSDSPAEFITVNPYSNKVHIVGKNRDSYTTEFSKIRIDLLTMEVIRNNTAYASRTDTLPYAEAADCICSKNPCYNSLYTGNFIVNMSGTGLIVDPNVKWILHGWIPEFQDWYRSGQVISTICGGHCGSCKPDGPMILQVYTTEVVPDSSAVMPSCLLDN